MPNPTILQIKPEVANPLPPISFVSISLVAFLDKKIPIILRTKPKIRKDERTDKIPIIKDQIE